MVINPFYIIAIVGLLAIIAGNLMLTMKHQIRRRFTYPLLILGGVCLEIYSIHIGDKIFIVLQAVFIIAALYGVIKLYEHKRRG